MNVSSLKSPFSEEASRIKKRPYRYQLLAERVQRARKACDSDDALFIRYHWNVYRPFQADKKFDSCIALGWMSTHTYYSKDRVLTRNAKPPFGLTSKQDLLFRILLYAAGASIDMVSLKPSVVLKGYNKMLSPSETQMSLPKTMLPSKRL